MTDIPIIFSAAMVQALFDYKTQTRRWAWREDTNLSSMTEPNLVPTAWKKVKPGDRLYVRENHYRYGRWQKNGTTATGRQRWRFKAFAYHKIPDGCPVYFEDEREEFEQAPSRTSVGWHLRPSIFLPRALSRLTLVVKATKIEPLNSISVDDALAEGTPKRAHSADTAPLFAEAAS